MTIDEPDDRDPGNLAVLVTLTLVKESSTEFLPLIQTNAANSLAKEPECHRFDVCINPAIPDEVMLYEVYEDRAAFDRHLDTENFQVFERESRSMVAGKSTRIYWLSR